MATHTKPSNATEPTQNEHLKNKDMKLTSAERLHLNSIVLFLCTAGSELNLRLYFLTIQVKHRDGPVRSHSILHHAHSYHIQPQSVDELSLTHRCDATSETEIGSLDPPTLKFPMRTFQTYHIDKNFQGPLSKKNPSAPTATAFFKTQTQINQVIRSAGSKPVNTPLVGWSANSFSSLGRHFEVRRRPADISLSENCTLTNVKGHLVVDVFFIKRSLEILSVPASSQAKLPSTLGSVQYPKQWSESKANNSAGDDAH